MSIVAVARGALIAVLASFVFSASAGAPEWRYRVVAEFPHDTTSFTEGLTMLDGRLLESTGRNGQSRLLIRNIADGKLLKSKRLADADFGEGTTVADQRIVQLTWKSGVGYFYDLDLNRLGRFALSGEGWGLTFDGRALIRSDGSSTLHYFSAADYSELRSLDVRDDDHPVQQLNELEWAEGRIYANVWMSDRIAVIAPADGHVIAWIDLGGLQRRLVKGAGWSPTDDVLNGIAFDPASRHFLVTGKYWPKLFEIAIEAP